MSDTAVTRFLLVEDSPADARLIQEYIRERSWPDADGAVPEIEHVERLEEGLTRLTPETDIVLLDLGLPDSTGLETLERMIEAEESPPVVVLTGLDDERIGVEAVEGGAQDYLVKDDLTPRLLQQTLRYAIQREFHQRQLQRQNERLEQRNTELALLNQLVRHDIRNDVTVILAWANTLEGYVDGDGTEFLERMVSAGEHITNITETVGDFLAVLSNERDLELRPIDLERVLTDEAEKVRSASPASQITLAGDHDEGVRVAATELVSSVFRNLLNNAVTHNDSPDPDVTVTVVDGGDTVSVQVADDGPGIPDAQKEEVFGRGEKGLESPGTGIGLYLVDTLVEMYGGAVAVSDNDPRGSVFTVTLQKYGR